MLVWNFKYPLLLRTQQYNACWSLQSDVTGSHHFFSLWMLCSHNLMPDMAHTVKLPLLLLLFFLCLSAKTTVTLHNHLTTAFQLIWQLKQGLLKSSHAGNTRRKSIISNKITKTVAHSNPILSCYVYPLTIFYALPMTSVNEGTFLIYSLLLRITAAVVLRSICCLLHTGWPSQMTGIALYDSYAFKIFSQRWSRRCKDMGSKPSLLHLLLWHQQVSHWSNRPSLVPGKGWVGWLVVTNFAGKDGYPKDKIPAGNQPRGLPGKE